MAVQKLFGGLLLALTVLCSSAHSRELTISTGGWPPFLTEDQRHQGFIAHLITDVFADVGVTVQFEFTPWTRAYQETSLGRYDATAVWMDAPDRHADFIYSEPVLNETFVFFHLKDKPFDWASFGDLRGMLIGGVLGYSYGAGFDAALEAEVFRMERVRNDELNFLKLLSERIDVYPQEVNVGYYALRRDLPPEDAERVTHHPTPLLVNQSFLLLPRSVPDSAELVTLFNASLQRFRDDGRYQTYFDAFDRGEYELSN
ncbi:transporter substrate-binding domain-containing protein [Salinispirillum sp. LH 10-3-1]|uniref:Transporter substrate-binding domain-containing protein n=1 Tax=Salinispirillum sp. LH 10-3-1 TaxID=2952525 RepID=A0AB38YHJ2_9GAMM